MTQGFQCSKYFNIAVLNGIFIYYHVSQDAYKFLIFLRWSLQWFPFHFQILENRIPKHHQNLEIYFIQYNLVQVW